MRAFSKFHALIGNVIHILFTKTILIHNFHCVFVDNLIKIKIKTQAVIHILFAICVYFSTARLNKKQKYVNNVIISDFNLKKSFW